MTSIEWTRNPDGSKGKSWNPIRAYRWIVRDGKRVRVRGWHCEHVHQGCKGCYAEGQNKTKARGGTGLAYIPGNRAKVEIELDEATLRAPLKWRKPTRIFVCSMTDLFGAWVSDEWLDKIVAVAALCPQHTFIILTKRPDRQRAYFEEMQRCYHGSAGSFARRWGQAAADVTDSPCAAGAIEDVDFPIPNVWLLTSCSEQKDADAFIPHILQTPAAVRGVSLEPLLGSVDLRWIAEPDENADGVIDALSGCNWIDGVGDGEPYKPSRPGHQDREMTRLVVRDRPSKIDWVIVGGESGSGARPMSSDWARSLRDQCKAAEVGFFFKQWGEYLPVGQSLPGCGKVHGATVVRPGRMKLHYGGTRQQAPKHAFAEHGVRFASMADERLTFRVGKKKSGRELDGEIHNGMPVHA